MKAGSVTQLGEPLNGVPESLGSVPSARGGVGRKGRCHELCPLWLV